MPQSIVDPSALHDFARFLHSHARRIQERTSAAKSNVKHLSAFWQDARYREFVAVFEVAMKDIDEFLAVAERQKRYIEQKARLGERFLRRG